MTKIGARASVTHTPRVRPTSDTDVTDRLSRTGQACFCCEVLASIEPEPLLDPSLRRAGRTRSRCGPAVAPAPRPPGRRRCAPRGWAATWRAAAGAMRATRAAQPLRPEIGRAHV